MPVGDEHGKTRASPMHGNPARQAHDAIRGYVYQLWYTVEHWIELEPTEHLYVEAAEDLDVSRPSELHPKQIKNTESSTGISLNQKHAIRSLNAFWRIQQKNPHTRIYYSFVTSAEPVHEKGFPLADKGIHVWNSCQSVRPQEQPDQINAIASFLTNHPEIAPDLRSFLQNSSVDDIHRTLIAPFHWTTSEVHFPELKRRIQEKVHAKGQHHALTVKTSTELTDSLFSEVARRASDKNSLPLTYLDFHQFLESVATVEVPRHTLSKFEELTRYLTSPFLQSATSECVPKLDDRIDFSVPPAPSAAFFYRAQLHQQLADALKNGILFASAGSGYGKTTEIRHLIENRKNVFWMQLRNSHSYETDTIIRQILSHLSVADRTPIVVLDDLETEQGLSHLERSLAKLREWLADRSGILVVTSYQNPGPRLCNILDIPNESVVEIPPFDETEITQFLSEQGCDPECLANLSRLTLIQTAGHPQLVSSRVNTLKQNDFPPATANDLSSEPKDIKDAKAEALKLVRGTLPEKSRELLYRLSLILTPVGRNEALSIAEDVEPIAQPGEAFAVLEGSWLERTGANEFRPSQLVVHAGKDVFSPKKVKAYHASMARVLLGRSTLDPGALSAILLHAWFGEAEREFATAATVFLHADEEGKETLARWLQWTIYLQNGEQGKLPFETKMIRQIARFLQWEVARVCDPGALTNLANEIKADFSIEWYEQSDVFARFMFLTKCLTETSALLPMADIVEYFIEANNLYRWIEMNVPEFDFLEDVPSLRRRKAHPSFEDLLFAALVPRVKEPSDIRALFETLSNADEDEQQAVLAALPNDDRELRPLFDAPYLEIKKNDDDKKGREYIEILQEALRFAYQRQEMHIVRAIARAISVVYEDVIGDAEQAKVLLQEAVEGTTISAEILDRFATVYFNEGNLPRALNHWRKFLSEWQTDSVLTDPQPIFSRRFAGIAAAKLGQFKEAGQWFQEAAAKAEEFGWRAWRAGLLADLGFVRWETGDSTGSVDDFAEAVRICDDLPNTSDAFAEYAVHKLIGHTLTYITRDICDLAPPPYGSCSNLHPSDGLAELTATPKVFLWFLLYQCAYRAGRSDTCLEAVTFFENSEFAFLRFTGVQYRLERKVRKGEVEDLPLLAEQAAKECIFARKTGSSAPLEPDPGSVSVTYEYGDVGEIVVPILIAGIWRSGLMELGLTELVGRWREMSVERSACRIWLDWFEDRARMNSNQLREKFKDQGAETWERILAAGLVMNSANVGPENLFYAQTILCHARGGFGPIRDTAGEMLSEIAKPAWQRLCGAPAVFVNPRTSVPEIREVCDHYEEGWRAVAAIVLKASDAVRVKLPDEIYSDIRRLMSWDNGSM